MKIYTIIGGVNGSGKSTVAKLMNGLYKPEKGTVFVNDIKAVNNNLTIITGGPGTGKTTVVHAIIKVYERLFPNNIIKLCAPTGRASKRMNYITGKEVFLKKIPNFLLAYEGISQNGNVKLQIVSNLC